MDERQEDLHCLVESAALARLLVPTAHIRATATRTGRTGKDGATGTGRARQGRGYTHR